MCLMWHPGHSHRRDLAFRAGILRGMLPGSPEALAATIAAVLAKYPKSGGGDPAGE